MNYPPISHFFRCAILLPLAVCALHLPLSHGQHANDLEKLEYWGLPQSETFYSRKTGLKGKLFSSAPLPNGEIAFLTSLGVHTFDGTNWERISDLQQVSDYAILSETEVAISHIDGISVIRPTAGGSYSVEPIETNEPIPIGMGSLSSITMVRGHVFATAGKRLIEVDEEGILTIHELTNWAATGFAIGDEMYVTGGNDSLLNRWDWENRALVDAAYVLDSSGIYEWMTETTPRTEGGVWILTQPGTIIGFDGEKTWPWPGNDSIAERKSLIRSLIEITPGELAIGTANHGLLAYDRLGRIKLEYSTVQGLDSVYVESLAADDQDGLWISTRNSLNRIPKQSRTTHFNASHGLAGEISSVITHKGRVYLGSLHGLFASNPDTESIERLFQVVIDQAEIGGLFIYKDQLWATGTKLWRLTENGQFEVVLDEAVANVVQPSQYPDSLILALNQGFLRLNFSGSEVTSKVPLSGPEVKASTIAESREGDLVGCLRANRYALFRLDEDGGSYTVHDFNKQRIFDWTTIASIDGRIYASDEPCLRWDHETQSFAPTDEVTYYVGGPPYGFEQVFGGSYEDAHFLLNSTSSITAPRPSKDIIGDISSLNNGTDTRALCAYYDEHGGLWAGGSFGLIYSKNPMAQGEGVAQRARIHKIISLNDNSVINRSIDSSEPIVLSSDQNSIQIHIEYPNFKSTFHHSYQIYLEGFDSEHPPFTDVPQRDITNIAPGDYTLYFLAMSVHQKTPISIGTPITVLPPWYKTLPAYILFTTTVLALIFLVVFAYNRNQVRRRKTLEALVNERTKEVESKNEKLKDQATRLERQNEELEDKTEELTTTTETLTNTLNQLQEMQDQLVDTARTAGKAEIAINVLHNVGNVLNSINVAIEVLSEKMENSKITNLTRIAILLESHRDDMVKFLSEDPKGKNVPEYLIRLSQALTDEVLSVQFELSVMSEDIDHVKSIIAAQQTHAKTESNFELLNLRDLCESALNILGNQITRSQFEIINDVPSDIVVKNDKHKLLDIILNLLTNSQDAIREAAPEIGVITFFAQTSEDGKSVELRVSDNGSGIDEETKKKLFRHGFTTKPDGHGFGLHSCANAAGSVGGSLVLDSPGKNQGATATLSIPVITESMPSHS